MAIHKVGSEYVISSNHVWLPGCFDSVRTAKYAFRFTYKQLKELQNSVNPGAITFEMLKELRESLKTLN